MLNTQEDIQTFYALRSLIRMSKTAVFLTLDESSIIPAAPTSDIDEESEEYNTPEHVAYFAQSYVDGAEQRLDKWIDGVGPSDVALSILSDLKYALRWVREIDRPGSGVAAIEEWVSRKLLDCDMPKGRPAWLRDAAVA